METRHVDYEQVGELTAYLAHLADATPHFADATSKDRAAANRIHDALIEQSYRYGDEDTGESLRPEFEDAETPYTLPASDWAFLERWFTNPERMGQWVMESIGCSTTQTRTMHWNAEGELINELHWLADGNEGVLQPDGTHRSLTPEEIAGAAVAVEALLGQSHAEPDGLTDEQYETLSVEEIDRLEEEDAQVEITLPVAVWSLIDSLCVGVEFGDGLGVVGTREEAVR